MQKIKQQTPGWLAKKLLLIGGAEIWTLVWHYKKSELLKLGVNLQADQPFRSPLAVFIKVRHGVQDEEFGKVNRDFGQGMEAYIGHRLRRELPVVKVARTKDFIANPELHPLACCSPDGYLSLPKSPGGFPMVEIDDVDKTVKINASWGRGASEKKTAKFHFNFDAEKGARWQYIFQHQFQMMVMNLRWGILSVLVPKEKQLDEDYEKGRIIERAENKNFKKIHPLYELFHYVYAAMPLAQKLIMESLEAFAEDLKNDNYRGLMSEGSEEMAMQDKIALGLAFPHRYGTLNLDDSAEHRALNALLTDRALASEAEKSAKIEKLEKGNLLVLETRKYMEVIGDTHRMAWDKRGFPRFNKLKEK